MCELWPRGALPAGYSEPVRSAISTLLVSGERDPVTPPKRGESALRHLSRGRHLVVADGGHDLYGLEGIDCVDRLQTIFIEAGAAEGPDTACLAGMVRPPFPPCCRRNSGGRSRPDHDQGVPSHLKSGR